MIKTILREFEEFVKDNCVYVWGGSGQIVKDVTIGQIVALEKAKKTDAENRVNVDRVLKHIGDVIRNQKGDVSKMRIFDCSGMVLFPLNKHGLFYGDATANMLYDLGTPITPNHTKAGDLVFNVTSNIKTHVGFVGEGGVVYECKGRDYGVIKSHVSEWQYAARYTWFEDLKLSRKLKLKKSAMQGDDVRNVQRALCSHGFPCAITGTFTQNTKSAVIKFQSAAGLKVTSPGTVARKTAVALGFIYK